MEEIINRWATDLIQYQKEFQGQAEKVAAWDKLLVDNGDKIQKLYAKTYEAERASSEVERQLSAVESQQDELNGWLDRYEREVDQMLARQVGPGESLQGPDQERERTYVSHRRPPVVRRPANVWIRYQLAETLSDRLDDMGKDLKNMIDQLNTASSTISKSNQPVDDPLSQIVKILNSHLSSLQWIDQHASALQAKIAAAQQSGQALATHGSSTLGDDAADDFYRSFTARR